MARAPRTPKTRTKVFVRADLLKRAKKLGLNLTALLENAIEDAIRKVEREAWQNENEQAIDEANAWIAKHGLFSDGHRKF